MTGPRTPVVLAIDAGTGSARVLAFNLDGAVVALASREWTHAAVAHAPGGTSFNTVAGWEAIAAAAQEVVGVLDAAGNYEIISVAASSMREGFVLYDPHGQEIWACPNTDGRARLQAEQLVHEGVADRIYELGGDWVSITAPARLRWLRQEQPDVFNSARHMGMLSDWVTYWPNPTKSGIPSADPIPNAGRQPAQAPTLQKQKNPRDFGGSSARIEIR